MDTVLNSNAKNEAPMAFNPDNFEEIIAADDLPWDTESEKTTANPSAETKKAAKDTPAKQETVSSITADDLTKIIVQKIKQNRSNSEKIGAILKTYGVSKVSELPQDKYEAFLTDVSQL